MRRDNGFTLTLIFVLLAFLVSILTAVSVSANGKPDVSARGAAALYEPRSERFLFSEHADVPLPMASTTKIMTALVAAERLSPSEPVNIPKEAVGTEGSSAYLDEGEVLTVKDLLFATLLQSANDAAAALAIHTAGSVEAFALLMNEKADELGLLCTNFTNPHGLHDEEHYTTAHDLAKIAAAALENPLIEEIAATKKATVTSDSKTRVFLNHNKLLHLYEGCVGVKTGFTRAAGRCLVGAAERDGVLLISVTLNAPNDWQDHTKLLDFGFDMTENRLLAKKGSLSYTLPVLGAKDDSSVCVELSDDVRAVLLKTDEMPEADVCLPRYLTAPLNEGECVGSVTYTLDGRTLAVAELTVTKTVSPKEKKGFFAKIRDFFTK